MNGNLTKLNLRFEGSKLLRTKLNWKLMKLNEEVTKMGGKTYYCASYNTGMPSTRVHTYMLKKIWNIMEIIICLHGLRKMCIIPVCNFVIIIVWRKLSWITCKVSKNIRDKWYWIWVKWSCNNHVNYITVFIAASTMTQSTVVRPVKRVLCVFIHLWGPKPSHESYNQNNSANNYHSNSKAALFMK